ncbi:MAG: hypothetical protein Q8Q32_00360 [bacterium]|nr:hypothetical protein [bacterium]
MKLTTLFVILLVALLLGSSSVAGGDTSDFQVTEDGRETYTIPIKVVNDTGCCVRISCAGKELGYMTADQKELVVQLRGSRGIMSNFPDPFQNISAFIFRPRKWIEEMECIQGLERDELCHEQIVCKQAELVMRDMRTGEKVSSGDIYGDVRHEIRWDVTWTIEALPEPETSSPGGGAGTSCG